jgi:concentrative nucleoside transporter, CNT family
VIPLLGDFALDINQVRSFVGVIALLAIAWALSENRKRFPWRMALVAVALQYGFAFLFFGLGGHGGNSGALDAAVAALQNATKAGTSFAFGYIGGAEPPFTVTNPGNGFSFAFQALPLVIVLAAISAVLWHWRIMQWIAGAFAMLFEKTLRLGGAVSLSTAANIFLGMVESAVVIGPYLKRLTRSELFVVMVTGLSTVAGSVMLLYVFLLQNVLPHAATHLLAASIMGAPAGILLAQIMIPDAEGDVATGRSSEHMPAVYRSAIDAFASGVEEGVKLLISITAMVLAAVAIVALLNIMLGAFPDVLGAPLSIERMLGWLLAPVMWLTGVPWREAVSAGGVMGAKIALNEVIGYKTLAELPIGTISDRTRMMLTYAVCGFANFSSLGIMLAGMGSIAPERKQEIISLLFKSLFAATLANLSTGAIVGSLPQSLF